jgi:hypothetical protein
MRCYSIIIILFCFYIDIYCQAFAPIGATWYYTVSFAFEGDIRYSKIESIGDTIINSKSCKILKKSIREGCSNRSYIEFFHENDSGEVFFYDSGLVTFQKLYDFNAVVGDSWNIKLTYNDGIELKIVDSVNYYIESISYLNINGYNLKVFHTKVESYKDFYTVNLSKSKIIENIGDVNSMFPWNIWFCDDNYISGLRCYEDNIIGFYSTGIVDSCNYTYDWTGIETLEKSDLLIYPNPAEKIINIYIKGISEFHFEIFDQSGRIVQSGVSFDSPIQSNISGLKPGFYFIRTFNTEKIIGIKTLLKM